MTTKQRLPWAALLYFAGALTALAIIGVRAPVHPDTDRDLLIARECVFGTACPGAGPVTSFGGFLQGALWSHLLELREWIALSIATLEWTVAAMVALGAAITALVAERLGYRATLATFVVWFVLTLESISYPILWNPSPAPLVLALFHLGLVLAARSGAAAAWTFAAVLLALSVDLHVAYAISVPFFIAALVACSTRPLLTSVFATAAFVEVLAVDSPGAFQHNAAVLAPWRGVLEAGLLSAVALGAFVRSRVRALPERTRARLVACGLSALYVVVAIALSVVGRRGLEPRYLAPVVTPLAIFAAVALDSLVARIRSRGASFALRSALLVLLATNRYFVDGRRPLSDGRLSLRAAERIAPTLYGHGAFHELFVHLRGPDAWSLLAAIAPFEPRDLPPRAETGLDVLVIRTAHPLPHPTPPGWEIVELGDGRAAVVTTYRPTVDVSAMDVCREGFECRHIVVDKLDLAGKASRGLPARAYPAIGALRRAFFAHEGEWTTYAVTVETAAPRRIHAFDDGCETFAIDAATTATTPLPAKAATLAAGRGEIVFRRRPRRGGHCASVDWLPLFGELGEPSLEALLPAP